MFKKLTAVLLLLIANFVLGGCATLADAKAERGTGPSREYATSMDKVWDALPAVLKELELPLVSQNRQEGTVLAQRGVSALSYGENVAIFVTPAGGNSRTRVEVVSKKTMATNVFATDWSGPILDKLGEKLR